MRLKRRKKKEREEKTKAATVMKEEKAGRINNNSDTKRAKDGDRPGASQLNHRLSVKGLKSSASAIIG
jgi:hypothetical protein